MSTCTYVRRHGDAYEFGIVRLIEGGTKKEQREYVARGSRPTMDEALKANSMALKGCPLIGQASNLPFLWKDH